MGDRANIKIKERNGNSIYVYTHWEGREWPVKLQDALKAGKRRWDDDQYLQRFIITEVCKGAEDETGYGVTSFRCDNEHDVMELDTVEKKVRKLSADGWFDDEWNPKIIHEWTYEEFIAANLTEEDSD
jgi:hypothetical protein